MASNYNLTNNWRVLALAMTAAGMVALTGCSDSDSGDSSNDDSDDEVTESQFNWDGDTASYSYDGNSPADIAQTSDASYDNNVNGVISGATLDGWIDDWANNKPDGIGGDLVILQVSTAYTDDKGTDDESDDVTTYHYISDGNDTEVRVYAIDTRPDTSRLTETRSNGVMSSRSMVPSGSQMDEFLADYDIDPNNDMVVWAMGAGGYGEAMRQGRGWYMMRYWGTPKENLAILNGGANHSDVMTNVEADTDQTTARDNANACDETLTNTCLPGGGTVSVADLSEDNLALQATQQDVMAAANGDVEDVFIWDARSEGEYMGTTFKTGGTQGHPRDAVHLEYSNLLQNGDDGANTYDVSGNLDNPGASYRYKSKADLDNYMTGQEVGFHYEDSGNYTEMPQTDEARYQSGDTVITYCETTFRAMITGVASGVVLGQPTRFYDGAMTEWNHMAHIQTSDGDFLLPNDSPWRTDWDSLSYHKYQESADIERHSDAELVDADADDTNAIIDADRAYSP